MSLISNVTDTKESVRQSKLDKHRAYNPPPPPQSGSNKIEVDPTKRKRRNGTGAAAPVEIVPGEPKAGKEDGAGDNVKKTKVKKEVPAAERRKREKERELVRS
jgi:hypothetical protein